MGSLTIDLPSLELPRAESAELLRRCEQATRRARRSGVPVLASHTIVLDGAVDPSAVIASARRDEEWFCWEQPDRDGAALATLGSVARIASRPGDRFASVAEGWRELAAQAVADPPAGPVGAGLVATGGFPFAPAGASASHWAGYRGGLSVPWLALARRTGEVRMTITVAVAPDDRPEALVGSVQARLAGLVADAMLPSLASEKGGGFEVTSVATPENFLAIIAAAVDRIRRGEMEKIVLAREVEVKAPEPYDIAAVYDALRSKFSSCYVVTAGRGKRAFIAASPELLVRRDGMRASTVALAGTTRRCTDPRRDAQLADELMRSEKNRAEHAIVVGRITRSLEPLSVWVTTPPEPRVIAIKDIQHLATPIRAQLRDPLGVVELAGKLHPTPAVGAEPASAVTRIASFEDFDRGWYAGPVGWTDANEDGEFCVGLRSALLDGERARLFAGVGVVRDSDPVAELAETEVKLGALLPILS